MRKVNLFAGKATVLLFFFLVTIFGCKKTDRAVDAKNIVQVETRFFNENNSSSPQIQAIANFLQRENRRNPFVEKLVNHTGFPIWNKSMIVANEGRQGQSRERPGNTVIFIPFAKDDQRVVSAAIRVTITPQRDTLFKVLLASKYLDTALAYIIKQAGVTLVKAPVGSNTFKKIGIRQKIENGSPAVDPSGTPVYENADCQ